MNVINIDEIGITIRPCSPDEVLIIIDEKRRQAAKVLSIADLANFITQCRILLEEMKFTATSSCADPDLYSTGPDYPY